MLLPLLLATFNVSLLKRLMFKAVIVVVVAAAASVGIDFILALNILVFFLVRLLLLDFAIFLVVFILVTMFVVVL